MLYLLIKSCLLYLLIKSAQYYWCIHVVVRTQLQLKYKISIVFPAFPKLMMTSLSIDEMLPSRYKNWSSNFKELPFRWLLLFKRQELCFIWVHVEANAFCCLFQAMQFGIFLRWCICKKR